MMSALVALSCIAMGPVGSVEPQSLEAGFKDPPAWVKPHTWWHWMGGNITKEGITADLEAMKFAGIGGAHIFDAGQGIPDGPVAYNSPLWRDMIAHAASEAQRLGLELAMHNCSGWSSTGGPWVTPDDAMKKVVWSETAWPDSDTVQLTKPPAVGGFYRDIAIRAFPFFPSARASQDPRPLVGLGGNPGPVEQLDWNVIDPAKIIDLTAKVGPDGVLTAQKPEGAWMILRIGYTLTGAHNVASRPTGEGLEVDKLRSQSLDHFMEGGMLPLFERIGEPLGKALTTIVIDSYETGFQNWTQDMVADFKRLRGYDPTPYLPALAGLAVKDKDTTLKFLFDYRRTLTDLWAENYSGHYAERLKEFGVHLAIEPYGNGSFDPNTYVKPAGLFMGEYWMGEGEINPSVKHTASIAHVYGRELVGAESLTAGMEWAGWRGQPRSWKPFADRGYVNGVNRIVYHRFAHQPWVSGVLPGMTMGPWGSNVDRTQTYWSFMPAWDKYLARCQYMLQSGQFVADACVFTGEGEPQEMGGEGYSLPEVPKGHDFDYCGIDPLMGLRVRNGLLEAPNGPTYRLLALPNTDWMSVPLARKLRELVLAGAVVVGPKPTKSPSLEDGPNGDTEVASIANDLWGSGDAAMRVVGKGRVYSGVPLQRVLSDLRVAPDFSTNAPKLTAIHRRIADADAYFVASSQHFPRTVECTFRVADKVPELWDPETGRVLYAQVWRSSQGSATVSIPLESDGSVFVVFRNAVAGRRHVVQVDEAAGTVDHGATKPLRILHAEYGQLDQPGKFWDVTKRVAAAVQGAALQIAASNDEMGGDPAYLVVKALRVVYEYGGEEKTATVAENETLSIGNAPDAGTPPSYELQARALSVRFHPGKTEVVVAGRGETIEVPVRELKNGPTELHAWRNGAYRVRWASGLSQKVSLGDLPEPVEVAGPWEVRFPAGWDAPPSVTLDKPASWTDSPVFGVKYFSGTATYLKRVQVPAALLRKGMRLMLDLGDVRECARVKLNGKLVGEFWKPPFRVDITDFAHPGDNALEVEVTNLWVNRLIGDEQLPDDMGWDGDHLSVWPEWFTKGLPRPEPRRKTFTTWRHNTKDSPELPSGLLGPVMLRPVRVIELKGG